MAIITIGFNPAIDRILECPDFHLGGHQKAIQVARLAAGKAANVNRALAQLGTDSIATGFVGTQALEFFHQQLLSAGPGRILCRFVEVSGQTRENISILDPKRKQETHLRDRGFSVTPAEAALLEEKITQALRPGDFAIFAGSLCHGLDEQFFSRLLDRCAEFQAKVVVDSSGSPLAMAVKKRLWLLKPNLEEFRHLLGVEVPNAAAAIRDAAGPWMSHVENILVTRGPLGAVLLTPQGTFSARLPTRDSPIRTVGCGDHLLAGLVSEICNGRSPEQALRVAMAVATARALSPRMDEFDVSVMKQALEQIEVQAM